MSGGQILEGDVKFFVQGNVSVIPSKVPHSSTKVGVNSENKSQDASLQPHLCDKNIEIWLGLAKFNRMLGTPSPTTIISGDAVSYVCCDHPDLLTHADP